MKRYLSTALPRLLISCAAISGALLASESHATDAQDKLSPPVKKTASLESQASSKHHQKKSYTAAERAPLQASQINARTSYSSADQPALPNRPSSLSTNLSKAEMAKSSRGLTLNKALAACDRNAFASASGAALVSLVKSSSSACINDLFGVGGAQANAIFKEAQMVTIAKAFESEAASYNGSNAGSALQMVMFLRAGYYVQFYDTAVGSYGTNLQTAIRAALDAFIKNPNFALINDVHGEILSEFITLIDSATENARYLNTAVKRMLSLNSSFLNFWYMRSAVNNAFTVLFRGHQNADFKSLVQSDPDIVDSLYNFMNANFGLLGTDNDYLVANAGREMARFLQYSEGGALKNLAKSRVKTMLDRSNVTGSTAAVWVGLGEMVDYYDKANCAYYNLCNFQSMLDSNVLPVRYSCSPTLKLKAQSLTSAQLQEACSIVAGEESYFHQQVQSGNVPVANDNNKQLEMVIFNSSKSYATYAGAIFGIDTNNGGMYLEGDPSAANNQARFIAYQAEWKLPAFEIWNLTHEYIHYLDGRFNMSGDFNAAVSVNSIWWIEGFAEYMSYSYRKLDYNDAKTQAAAGTYKLSQIFNNDYSSGQTRVYNWGYLAVRYMFEKQRNRVSTLLNSYFRPGNYSAYTSYMNGINTTLDADFSAWLPCVNNGSLPQCSSTVPPANKPPLAAFNSSINGLSVSFSDTSTDSDGSIVSRSWDFGDGSSSSASNPSKTYSNPGSYTVTLTVKDNAGDSSKVAKTINLSNGGNLPECPGSAAALGKNCSRSNVSSVAGDYAYLYLSVPAGTTKLTISTSGGTGNADMYVSTNGSWPSRDHYNASSVNPGNNESVIINNPPAGYIYISLYGVTKFSGLKVTTQY